MFKLLIKHYIDLNSVATKNILYILNPKKDGEGGIMAHPDLYISKNFPIDLPWKFLTFPKT